MWALLIFPVCAILWMVLNARLGLVQDQPPQYDEEASVPPASDAAVGAAPRPAQATRV
ncbi:hypothetical protein ACTTAF_10400 [Rhodobacter capsulatus]|uniref:hypothetical protein n=1 Tax=Rhodobacter capsulatus TaxID=1061 RepID=UPI0003D35E94|nr:hypothetical protein [Rhodobacter capsulatus]ETD82008.1 hypothetical protein U703_14150 [Rhodobacter capsulatus YW1]